MRPIRCHHFEAKLDDWVSGTLPDFERARMDEHESDCAACRELAEASRTIVQAAHREALEIPGDAYFLDLRTRLEGEVALRARAVGRGRARLFSPGEYVSFAAAAFCALLMLATLPIGQLEHPHRATVVTAAGLRSADPPAEISMQRNRQRISDAMAFIDRST